MGHADVPKLAVAAAVVGRGSELELIRGFLGRAVTSGDALLLLGEPGVGKSVLLDAASEMASAAGARVLRAGGVEFEADVAFSGLHQLLFSLHDEFALLSDTHREALNVALGFGAGRAPDRLVVSNAALTLLRWAGAAHPLVAIVDDLPWLDRASAGVLGFVARRLAGSRVGFLAASRSGDASFFDRAGLPEHELDPLDDDAAMQLMSAQFPALAPRVRERLLAAARGNPLAVLELPAALNARQRAALRELPAVLPLSRRLQALFASRIAELDASSGQLLLLAALDGTGDLRILQAAASGASGLDDLAAAERARLVYIDERTRRIGFRHPLIRSAVVELSTDEERRSAHRLLAELRADQPERQAWHLADATIEPDEQVAGLLEQAAHQILRRGDTVGGVAALMRAGELSPSRSDRSRRLGEAAYIGAEMTGGLRDASELLAEVRRVDPKFKQSLQAAVAASAVLLQADGDVDTAHRLLVGAIQSSARDVGESALEEALHTLMVVCFFSGQPGRWEPFYDAIARLEPHLPEALGLCSKTFADPVRRAAASLQPLDRAIEGLEDEPNPTRIVRTAIAGLFVDRLGGCREPLWRVVRDGRQGGAVTSAIQALTLLVHDDFWTGQWDEAQQLIDEANALCEAHGYQVRWTCRLYQAELAAARGDYGAAQAAADEMMQWAVPRGVRSVQWFVRQVQTLAALGRGDFEEAYQRVIAISPAGTLPSYCGYALYVAMDLVEAAVRTGRHDEAAAHVTAMRDANLAAISSRLALLTAGSGAMAAPDAIASGMFEEALAIPGVERWSFDLARVQLTYGERLRRIRAMTESRMQLTAALETFERLAARPWAERARSELRATGQTKPRADEHEPDSLTPQEREIAMLAAAGLSNKQIGQRLFLSHRTVGNHLFRVFPKLGITSRAALRDALASLPPEQDRDRPS
ncbi:MAG TPA: AAA family ATPase [Solirubrobacteraceae bacterium]|nr:AAA family ATPase [Solirubrobacteraceae bacterium]